MRIILSQTQIIKTTIDRILGVSNKVRLFGYLTNDKQSGDDMDLFIETKYTLPNCAIAICKVYDALIMVFDERKIDIGARKLRNVLIHEYMGALLASNSAT
jgi:hypothetical protein